MRSKALPLESDWARQFLIDDAASQKAMVGAEILPILEEEAKERQGARTDIREIIPGSSTGKASEQAAKIIGVGGRYVSDAKKIVREAPEIATHVAPVASRTFRRDGACGAGISETQASAALPRSRCTLRR
jgi:hypothetical protein